MKKFLREKSISKVPFFIMIILLTIAALEMGGATILKLGIYGAVTSGNSMEKTIHDGGRVLEISSAVKSIKRGDLVSIEVYLDDEKTMILKRVIAMPGETIDIKGANVYINGEILDEPYAYYSEAGNDGVQGTLREDEYFVMGDNRIVSLDSRHMGPIPKDAIKSVVLKYK